MARLLQRLWMIVRSRLKRRRARGAASQRAQRLVQDIERLIQQARLQAAHAAAEVRRLERTRERSLAQADEWARRAAVALKSGREDLARESVQRERHLRELSEGLLPQLSALTASSAELCSQVQALERRLEEAALRLRQLAAHESAVKARATVQALQGRLDSPLQTGDFGRLDRELDEWSAELKTQEELHRDPVGDGVRLVDRSLPEIDKRLAELRAAQREQGQDGNS